METWKHDLEHAKEYFINQFTKKKECEDINVLKDDEIKLLFNFDFVKLNILENQNTQMDLLHIM